MKKSPLGWLNNSTLSLKKGLLVTFIVYFILALIYSNGGKDFIYSRLVHPLVFQLRNKLGYSNPLDSRIKIYAIDQKTMNSLEVESIPISDWTALFTALGKAKPKAVFIDKVFSLPYSKDSQQIQALYQAIASVPNLTALAMVTPGPLTGLSELETDKSLYEQTDFLKTTTNFVYGPRSELVNAFTHIGQAHNEDNGYIKPILRTTNGKAIPYWSLYAAPFKVEDHKIISNETVIPLDEQDKVLVNLSSPDSYWNKSISMINVMKKARNNEPLDEIKPENIIIILTGMYQGSQSWKTTPAGNMVGSFILVEAVNSVLTKTWLQPIRHELLLLALFCLMGFAINFWINLRRFWLSLMLIETLIVSIGVSCFVFYGLLLPWAFPMLGLFFSGVVLFAERSKIMEQRANALQYSLEGMIDSKKLKELMNNPDQFKPEPKNQVLTIMFIDIVGFSTLAARTSPTVTFGHLRELLGLVSNTVREAGGIVDRTLGDGLLCYFGYQFDTNSATDHKQAEKALNCAQSIQRQILQKDIMALKEGKNIFPLRIGINTGEVFVGDLGGTNKIDFTVIGHSVNLAQRMESACENYRILCGPMTRASLDDRIPTYKELNKKLINIKNQEEPFEAFELDPVINDPSLILERDQLCQVIEKSKKSRKSISEI